MENFDQLDTSAFKGFYHAAKTLNFTQAAQKGGMTQSGVSQHVSRLESQLGAPLFLRVGRRVILTETGKTLKGFIDRYLDQLEVLVENVRESRSVISGRISYAMPASCLMSGHFFILLGERAKKYPLLDLKVKVCPSKEVTEKLLAAEIDFGFVTQKTSNPLIEWIPFCPEEFILVSGKKPVTKKFTANELKEANWISHPGAEGLFALWAQHHFPRSKNLEWESFNIKGEMNHLEGAILMVQSGMGMTVIPKHCVASELEEGSLFEVEGPALKPLTNMIHIVTLAGTKPPRRVQAVIDVFLAMHHN